MRGDPRGYYQLLGIPPGASPATITAAFRRQAKRLHPDVPVTGDADEFRRLKEAYDVLASPSSREAYGRLDVPDPAPLPDYDPEWTPGPAPAPPPVTPDRAARQFRPSPVLILLLTLATVGAITEAARRVGPPPHDPWIASPPAHPEAASTLPSVRSFDADPGPTPAAKTPWRGTYYIQGAFAPAVVWQYDPERRSYAPRARVAPFTELELLRIVTGSGMAEARFPDGTTGFVEAAKLIPGDHLAARNAYCTFNAGPPPRNGEILSRHSGGPRQLVLVNRGDESQVVRLMDPGGHTVASVFIAPRGQALIDHLPPQRLDVQFAEGAFWSRDCGVFTAAMRARRTAAPIDLTGAQDGPVHLALPPDDSDTVTTIDIPDALFAADHAPVTGPTAKRD